MTTTNTTKFVAALSAGAHQNVVKQRAVDASATCSATCSVSFSVRITIRGSTRAYLASGHLAKLTVGRTAAAKLSLSRAAVTAIRQALARPKVVTVSLLVVATDTSTHTTSRLTKSFRAAA